MRPLGTYGEALLDEVGRPIVVGQRREFFSGQVRDPRCLEDDGVQEKEKNEREPGGRLFRIDIRSWVLHGAGFDLELGRNEARQGAPWDRTEHIELERTME